MGAFRGIVRSDCATAHAPAASLERCLGSDVFADNVVAKLVEDGPQAVDGLASPVSEEALPAQDDQVDDIDCDEVHGEQREHHECSLGLLGKPGLEGRPTSSLLHGVDKGSGPLLDVCNEVEETAAYISSSLVLSGGVDKRKLKVDHHPHRPMENGDASFLGNALNKPEEALVYFPVLALDKTVEHWEGDFVLDDGVKYVELGEGRDYTSEGPVSLDEGGCCEQVDRAIQPEDDDVFSVVAEDVVCAFFNHLGEVCGHSFPFLFASDNVTNVFGRQ